MRTLICSIHSTANNIVTGPPSGDETDFMQWAQAGIEDSLSSFLDLMSTVDTIVLGRGTYEDLVRKWPMVRDWPEVTDETLRLGERVNTASKLVVTGTLPAKSLTWGEYDPPTRIEASEVVDRIAELKRRDGGDIVTFGSPVLVRALTDAGLIDEYQIIVHPVIVNEGRRLFEDLKGRTDLRLVGVEPLAGGAMVVTYALAGS